MSQTLELQEIAIAITVKNLNPTALNLDFLQYSDIIDSDWELARPPVYTRQQIKLGSCRDTCKKVQVESEGLTPTEFQGF